MMDASAGGEAMARQHELVQWFGNVYTRLHQLGQPDQAGLHVRNVAVLVLLVHYGSAVWKALGVGSLSP